MYTINGIYYSDFCGSFPSYEDNNSNSITETNQVVKVVENGMRIHYPFIILCYDL